MTKPSVGFLFLVVVALGAAGFFGWGLMTPPLERAWTTMIDLEAGARGRLDKSERKALTKMLRRHPGLASPGIISANEDGRIEKKYAYVVRRSAKDPGVLRVRGDVRVVGRLGNDRVDGNAEPNEPFEWTLPNDGPFPQLVELRFPKKKKRRAVVVEVTR